MKKLALFVFMLAALVAQKSWACSIQINDTFSKNLLVTAAANEFDIGLASSTSISVADYSHQLGGTPPAGSSCEEYLETRARVTIAYRKNFLETCELSVEVIHREFLNAEEFPFEEYRYNFPASSCTRRPLIIKPPVRTIPRG